MGIQQPTLPRCVVFVVGDGDGDGENVRRIPAHKVVLCARSPYFKTMLTGGMKVCLVYLRFVNVVQRTISSQTI